MNISRIARVFPRRTSATPDDPLAFTTAPPKFLFDSNSSINIGGIDEIHVSVAFTYDIPKAEQLAESWIKTGLPIKFGEPAVKPSKDSSISLNDDFVSGLYLKQGYVIR